MHVGKKAQVPDDKSGIDAKGIPGTDQESSESAGKENLVPGLSARAVDVLINCVIKPHPLSQQTQDVIMNQKTNEECARM